MALPKILNVVGARPNFMKIGPLLDEMKRHREIEASLINTGQHYDQVMAETFFQQLGLPVPDMNLEVGSASHAQQTAQIMLRFEPLLLQNKPDLVLVAGDVNSTIACALVAAKLGIKVAHVEAGLRSFDRTMPEEINRILTDSISDFLFTTEISGNENLLREGISPEKIFFVGNVMIDTLNRHKEKAQQSPIINQLGLTTPYALLTLHRPSNVDNRNNLAELLATLQEVSRRIPLIFPVHPRTAKQIAGFGFGEMLHEIDLNRPKIANGINILPPLGYLEFLCLMSKARLILTDSGGIQEESTVLQVPCLTLRENTERPVTVIAGTNTLVGGDREKILTHTAAILAGAYKKGRLPEKWDGQAAQRIVKVLKVAQTFRSATGYRV
ncbi:MAG: UDP-N-acetylglucosamine 2-epimerase (non-hydrolyzing) [Candidatus Schekmanbacteria bacterium]|nr:UDP-N-acetylglucosamine 2-epimerase (non-hydrolyzing) [Candidatus Schekmanbacteria bacterium]